MTSDRLVHVKTRDRVLARDWNELIEQIHREVQPYKIYARRADAIVNMHRRLIDDEVDRNWLIAEIDRLRAIEAKAIAQSETVQRDWLSPAEAAGLRGELDRLRAECESLRQRIFSHRCSQCTGSNVSHCVGCGAPMAWPTGTPHESYDALRAENARLLCELDAAMYVVVAAAAWHHSVDSPFIANPDGRLSDAVRKYETREAAHA